MIERRAFVGALACLPAIPLASKVLHTHARKIHSTKSVVAEISALCRGCDVLIVGDAFMVCHKDMAFMVTSEDVRDGIHLERVKSAYPLLMRAALGAA